MASLYHTDFQSTQFCVPEQMGGYPADDHDVSPTDFMFPGQRLTPASSPTNHLVQKQSNETSLDYIRKEYDYFVNSVISHVLIRIDEDPAQPAELAEPTHTPYLEHDSFSPPEDVTPSPGSDDLYWGSDLSFGPNGYHPLVHEPIPAEKDRNLLDIYAGYQAVPSLQTPAPSEESSPVQKQGTWSVSISDGDGNGNGNGDGDEGDETYRNKRKKRRRLLHIIAERNRRRNQNDLYEELYRIVPGLEQARSTKREVLERTADCVERLVDDNKKLEAQLLQLQAQSRTD